MGESTNQKIRNQTIANFGRILILFRNGYILIINNALNELHKTTNIDTKNIRYVLDQKQTSNKTQTSSKHKLILLPLLNIAIKSELKKINSTFGHYGNGDIVHNDDHLQMKTPSVSFAETP